MDRTHAAALPPSTTLRASRALAPDGRLTYRLVEACVLLVALLSGAVALASNLVALLRG